MVISKPDFGAPAQAAVITLVSLANGAARQSTPWDWSQYIDILIAFQLTAGASGVVATGSCTIYAFATVDNGTTYTGGAGAADAAITLLGASELLFLGRSFLNGNNQVRKEGPYSLAAIFGGTLPAKGGVVVVNESGAALAASGQSATWQGVRIQSA